MIFQLNHSEALVLVSLLDILEGNYGCEWSRYFRVVYKSADLSTRAV